MGVQSPGTFLFVLVGLTLQPSKAVLVYIKSIHTAEGARG